MFVITAGWKPEKYRVEDWQKPDSTALL